MAITGTRGVRLFMSTAPIADTIDTEVEFFTTTYTEIGLVETIGEFGRQFEVVSFQGLFDGRTLKLKGGFNDGTLEVGLGQDLSDAGQELLKEASEDPSQDNYGFRIELA